jgi:acid phosphatase (class A)
MGGYGGPAGDGGMGGYGGQGFETFAGGSTDLSGTTTVVVPMAGALEPLDVLSPQWPLIKATTFPKASWDPVLRAQLILAEFAQLPWRNDLAPVAEQAAQLWRSPGEGADPIRWESVEAEINNLLELRMQRAARMGEIVAQAQDLTGYWADLLMTTPTSRPATWTVISGAMAIGHIVAMHFKYKYNRPRPVQVFPALMPAVMTPPHASFPNSHALQSRLISELMILVCPALKEPLTKIASRVAENREIAGVHYGSDKACSEALAEAVLGWIKQDLNLQDSVKFPVLCGIITEAKVEWGDLGTFPHEARPDYPKPQAARAGK